MELTAKEEKLAKLAKVPKGMYEKSYRTSLIHWGVMAIICALILALMMMVSDSALHRFGDPVLFWSLMFLISLSSYLQLLQKERYVRLTRKLLAEIELLEQNQKA